MHLVVVLRLASHHLHHALLAVAAELYLHPLWVVVVVAQKQFRLLVVAFVVGHPGQGQDPFLQGFPKGHSADSSGVGSGEGLDFIFLEVAMFVVEGFGGSGHGGSGDVVVVLELPVGPAAEVELHEVGQNGDFFCALHAVGEGSELGHEPSRPHGVDVLFFGGHLQTVERLAKLCRFGFSQGSHIGTVDVIAEHLPLQLVLARWSIDETASEHVDDAGFEEDGCFFIDFANGLQDPAVGWEEVFVVGLAWKEHVCRVGVGVVPDGFVDELVPDQVGLIREVGCDDFPKFAQVVQESPLVCKQVLLQLHHVVGQVELCELNLQAVLPEGEALFVEPHLQFEGGREGLPLSGPHWQSFSAKLPGEQVLVGIQEDTDAELMAFPEDISESLDVGVVVDSFLGFYSFPSCVQADGIHSPVFEVPEVLIGEAVVGGKLDQVGVEGVGLVHCVDPVEDHVAVEAVHEEGVLGVHFDGLGCYQQQEGKESRNQLFHGDLYYSNPITLGNPSSQPQKGEPGLVNSSYWSSLVLVLQIQMHNYREDDLGQFNDSTVFLQPVTFNPKAVPTLAKHHNPEWTTLGIYDSIKLTPYIENKTGELIQFISLDPQSRNTFVSNEAMSVLERYSSEQLCLVVVVGNRGAGKSFFCDKLLNLSEIRGNHFCRSKSKGINMWSTPFCKDDLKIFFLEISNCDINSQDFKILSTYALLIGSAFITLEAVGNTGPSPIEELDQVIAEVVDRLTPSRIEEGHRAQKNSDIFLPKIYYNLQRSSGRSNIQGLKCIQFYANELLPDALQKRYTGPSSDLLHLPFQDTKCINQDYIRRIATIFGDLYSRVCEKRYKELTLNGNIIAKVVKEVEKELNGGGELNVEELYLKVINDLYQSAYNYCILNYHEDMQSEFEDERPKSLEQLLLVFERVSENALVKFQEFNLDEALYQQYYSKLERHIAEKEQIIMDINRKKTEQVILEDYDQKEVGNIKYYRQFVELIEKEHKELTHGRAEIIARVNSQFYIKSNTSNSIELQTLRAIEALKDSISTAKKERDQLVRANQEQAVVRSKANKEQEGYLSVEHELKSKIHNLQREITRVTNSSLLDPAQQKQEEHVLRQKIDNNKNTIEELRGTPEKDHRIAKVEKKIEEVMAKCSLQERLLKELQEAGNNATESVLKESRKPRQQSKKVQSK